MLSMMAERRKLLANGKLKVLSYVGAATALSLARYNMATATVGNYALFAGGNVGSATSSVVDAYNSALVRSTPTVLMVARDKFVATDFSGYAVFAGGAVSASSWSNSVDVYDSTLTRTNPVSLTVDFAAERPAMAKVGGYLLVGSGYYNGSPLAVVNAFTSNFTRTTPTALSSARNMVCGGTLPSYGIFAGGTAGATFSNTVDAYSTSLVRTTPTTLTVGRQVSYSGANVGRFAVIAGDTDGNGTVTPVVDAFDDSLARYTPTALSIARKYFAFANIGKYCMFLGGANAALSSWYGDVDTYNENLVRGSVTALATTRMRVVAATIGGYVLVGGGLQSTAVANVEVYKLS